nr:TPR domain-containing protein [uncultured bacterium]
MASASLSLIELEVLEARRTVTEFQKTPKALAQHLLKAIPEANKSDLEAVLDLGILTDELMGAGTWSKLNDSERNLMSSAYRRALHEIIDGYGQNDSTAKMRLLHLEEKENTAEAICLLPFNVLLKLRLARRNDTWYLVEIVETDTNLNAISEVIKPTVTYIENARAGRKAAIVPTEFTRALLLIHTNADKALAVVDDALKTKPSDPGLRLLKTLALLNVDKKDEAIKLLRELSNEGFVPAVYRLAAALSRSEDEKLKAEATPLYKRYTELEPHDPRGFRDLAIVSEDAEPAQAEAAYRKVIELNPADTDGYLNLITFLVVHDRVGEVRPLLAAADKMKDEADVDVFASVLQDLTDYDDSSYAEKLAASEPLRMKTSASANLALASLYGKNERYALALRHYQTAAQLDKTSARARAGIAFVHRKQGRLSAALREAQQAIALNAEDGDAHWELACALARLGRIKQAMAALEKAVELDPDLADWLADEPDLKPLAHLPAFKKLLPPPEKNNPR